MVEKLVSGTAIVMLMALFCECDSSLPMQEEASDAASIRAKNIYQLVLRHSSHWVVLSVPLMIACQAFNSICAPGGSPECAHMPAVEGKYGPYNCLFLKNSCGMMLPLD